MKIIFLTMILGWTSTGFTAVELDSSDAAAKGPGIFERRAEKARENLQKRWGPNEVLDGEAQAQEAKPYREPQIDPQMDFEKEEGSIE